MIQLAFQNLGELGFDSLEQNMVEKNKKISFNEITYANMFTLEAIIKLLDEKGLVGKIEIINTTKEIMKEQERKVDQT